MKRISMNFSKVLIFLILLSFNVKAQQVKDFTLQSATDKSTFTLRKSKGNFIALHFLLKTECPYCIKHTNEYMGRAGEIPGLVHVFIKPDDENEIREWSNKLGGESVFPIYQDKGAAIADLYEIPSDYFFHGQTVHYPALVLLNQKGREVFRYVGKNNGDRYPFDALKNKMVELKTK